MNTLYWYKQDYMWRKDITTKQKYDGAKFIIYFKELAKIFPLQVVQKREGN